MRVENGFGKGENGITSFGKNVLLSKKRIQQRMNLIPEMQTCGHVIIIHYQVPNRMRVLEEVEGKLMNHGTVVDIEKMVGFKETECPSECQMSFLICLDLAMAMASPTPTPMDKNGTARVQERHRKSHSVFQITISDVI
jgi:hypothetical protein